MDMDMNTFISMMKSGLVHEDYDPDTGLHTVWKYDPIAKKVIGTITASNTQKVLAENQAHRANNSTSWKGDVHRVARIPNLAAYNYCADRGITTEHFLKDQKEIKRFLNDPDNQEFRLKNGRI